jgi:gas vesicle protein
MKRNKGLIVALAAGAAVAGLVAFLAFTETGKKTTKKWKVKGKKVKDKAESIITDARKKFDDLREEFVSEYKNNDLVNEQYQE